MGSGMKATARNGPPLPPSIFMGRATSNEVERFTRVGPLGLEECREHPPSGRGCLGNPRVWGVVGLRTRWSDPGGDHLLR